MVSVMAVPPGFIVPRMGCLRKFVLAILQRPRLSGAAAYGVRFGIFCMEFVLAFFALTDSADTPALRLSSFWQILRVTAASLPELGCAMTGRKNLLST